MRDFPWVSLAQSTCRCLSTRYHRMDYAFDTDSVICPRATCEYNSLCCLLYVFRSTRSHKWTHIRRPLNVPGLLKTLYLEDSIFRRSCTKFHQRDTDLNKKLEYNGLKTCRGDRFFSTPLLLYMEKSKNDRRITKPQIYLNPTIETTTLKLRMPLESIKLPTAKY